MEYLETHKYTNNSERVLTPSPSPTISPAPVSTPAISGYMFIILWCSLFEVCSFVSNYFKTPSRHPNRMSKWWSKHGIGIGVISVLILFWKPPWQKVKS
jgi:hypothetical protein